MMKWSVYYNWKGMASKSAIQMLIPNAMEFMVRNNKIISYLDIRYDLEKNNWPVKKIIIGPNCGVSEWDIFHLLEFYHFEGNKIEIVKSDSSYSI